MTDGTEHARVTDLAGLVRRLVRLARDGALTEFELDQAEARAAATDGTYWDTLGLRPSECRRFIVERLVDIRATAKRLGYAVAVHGSGDRDVDLVAVPWREIAEDPDGLVVEIMATIGHCELCSGEQPTLQAHGRASWSIWLHDYSTYIDLSVMSPDGCMDLGL